MRFPSRLATLTLIIILLIPATVHGQDQSTATSTGRTFNPPVTTIEITGNEPVTKTYEMQYGLGGGGGEPAAEVKFHSSAPYWLDAPIMEPISLDRRFDLEACNYTSSDEPRATLTDPDGKQEQMAVTQDRGARGAQGCWVVEFEPKIGMPIGIYTLTLEHPQGRLTLQWGVEYSLCVDVSNGPDQGNQLVVSGLFPNQTITAYIFRQGENDPQNNLYKTHLVAQRQITADSDGAVIADIRVARSAPDKAFDTIFVTPDGIAHYGFAITDMDKTFAQDFGFTYPFQAPMFVKPSALPGKYVSYGVYPKRCDGQLGPFAQASLQAGPSVALYANYGDTSNQVASVPAGDPVRVLEQKAGIVKNHVVVWTHVHTENGAEGWSYGNEFQPAVGKPLPGSKLEIQPISTKDGYPVSVIMRQAPDPTSAAVSTLSTGDQVILVNLVWSNDLTKPDWAYVQDQSGNLGFIPSAIDFNTGQPTPIRGGNNSEVIYVATYVILPWSTIDVFKVTRPPSAASPTCPNGLISRLYVDSQGRVLEGDPNLLNSLPKRPSLHPDSVKVGEIPANGLFTVIDGPQCADGITWWNVFYNNMSGWTGEGDSKGYWVEPAN